MNLSGSRKPKYAVVACASENMVPAACCALLSAKQSTAAQTVTYFLVGVDVGAPSIGRIRSFAATHGMVIDFREHAGDRPAAKQFGGLGFATIARLDLGAIIPPDFDRVLYIDADVLICDDILQLLETDLRGSSLGAVESINPGRDHRARKSALGMADHHAYFNAGVLLFDWPKTLAEGYLSKARKLLDEEQFRKASDQAVLNATIRGNLFLLPQRWNTKPILFRIVKDIGIAHFVGRIKPWHRKCPLHLYKYRMIYKNYLARTPFDTFVEDASLSVRIRLMAKEVIRFLKGRHVRSRASMLYRLSEARRHSLLETRATEPPAVGP